MNLHIYKSMLSKSPLKSKNIQSVSQWNWDEIKQIKRTRPWIIHRSLPQSFRSLQHPSSRADTPAVRPYLQLDGAVVHHLQHVQDVVGVLHHEVELHVELAADQLRNKRCAGQRRRGARGESNVREEWHMKQVCSLFSAWELHTYTRFVQNIILLLKLLPKRALIFQIFNCIGEWRWMCHL